jgi:ABC-2 type transport system permease protein
MKSWIAFWNIVLKDIRAYYLKPPNISWGLIFPIAWTGMFFIKSGAGSESIPALLTGVIAISILFSSTSMLAVTVTFEKKGRSFERLLLAPIPLGLLMLAKTSGAILFGVANACVPVIIALFLADLFHVVWMEVFAAAFMIAIASTFLGLFIAVSVSEVLKRRLFLIFFVSP